MKRYRGNEKVEPGLYFNLGELSFKSMEEEGHLPGARRDEYWRVPVLALLIAGPVLGGVYVIFLPFIGFAMVAGLLAGKLAELTGVAALVRVLKPAWQPAMAFFTRGRRRKTAAGKPKKRDCWVEDIEKELAEEETEYDGAA